MVEAELTAEGKKTKGGIVVGFEEDTNFYSEVEDASVGHEADLAQVVAPVFKVPPKLYYNPDDHHHSMPWDCDMELQVGDFVWFSVLESRNATAIRCNDKLYKLIPYSECYCAKRGKEVIMLNGFILLERVFEKNTSPLAIYRQGDWDITKGIVRYVGKPNREYINENYVDFVDLEVGDEVLLSPRTALIPLERKSYMAKFDNDKLYWVVQARKIAMVLSKGN